MVFIYVILSLAVVYFCIYTNYVNYDLIVTSLKTSLIIGVATISYYIFTRDMNHRFFKLVLNKVIRGFEVGSKWI